MTLSSSTRMGSATSISTRRDIIVNSASATLSFRNNFDTEFSGGTYWDGGVLEVSSPNINGGAFTDVTDPAVGGSFVTGGYTGEIDGTANNPLAGRHGVEWEFGRLHQHGGESGTERERTNHQAALPDGNRRGGGAPGWRIDTISIVNGTCPSPTPGPSGTPSATPTATAPATPSPSPSPNCNQYTITQIGGSIVPGTTDIGNHGDDTVTTIALPFHYTLYDQSFTSINLSSNGNAQFTTTDTAFTNQCLPWPPTTTRSSHTGTICIWSIAGFGIFTSVSGTAPNRIFNIEWRAQYFPGSGNANYELRLYEGQSRFDIIYGTVTNGNTSATAGVQKNDTVFTQYFCNGAGGAATGGQSYTLPQGACPTPTPSATATATATSRQRAR